MKKLITSIFIVFMMITTIIPVNALEENKSIDYLSNGDYIETTITSNMSNRNFFLQWFFMYMYKSYFKYNKTIFYVVIK